MENVRLPNGQQYVIRSIRADDGDRLEAAYGCLSARTKYLRFLGPKPRLSSGDVRYLVGADGVDHVALVATPADDPERIVAVARFVRLREDPHSAEVAVVVGDPFQGQGLGSALVDRLAAAARARGVDSFHASVLAGNAPALRLVRRLGGKSVHLRHVAELEEIDIELVAA